MWDTVAGTQIWNAYLLVKECNCSDVDSPSELQTVEKAISKLVQKKEVLDFASQLEMFQICFCLNTFIQILS